MLGDRDVLADPEGVLVEAVAGLVVGRLAVEVVMEGPADVARMDEVAVLVVLARIEIEHGAFGALLVELIHIDAAEAVERRDELVAVPGVALRELGRAGKFETDTLQHGKQPPGTSQPERFIASA